MESPKNPERVQQIMTNEIHNLYNFESIQS